MQAFLRLTRQRRGWGLRWAAFATALLLSLPAFAEGQLLPNAEQTFVDLNGRPLAAGQVYFYIPDTTTLKDTWKDAAFGVLNTNPVVLDAAGRAIIYGSGHYSQKVLDVHGNLQWNQKTQTVGTVTSLVGEHGIYTTPDPLVETGLIGCTTATTSLIGCVIPDGSSITVDGNGVIAAHASAVSLTGASGISVSPNPITGTGVISCSASTLGVLGCVRPDGTTIAVAGSGIINCIIATSPVVGCVRPDGTSITITGAGVISALTRAVTTDSFTSPGGFTWTAPAGVTVIRKLTVIGGGGAGGFGDAMGGVGSGGSAGATGIKTNIVVVPGNIYSGSVGAGGAGNLVGDGAAGANSTLAIGATSYTAYGGPGGLSTAGPSTNSPGLSTTPINFDAPTTYQGGQGFFGFSVGGAIYSGQGGSAQLGGGGGVGGGGTPSPGVAPGGGGGGSGAGLTGGNGGNGVVYIEYLN